MKSIVAALALAQAVALPVQAQTTPAFKSWVSSTGVDSGTCQLAAPCKTIQYAHDQIAANGEIDVVNSGSYGTIRISKSVTLVAPDGVLATISVPQNGIGINVYAPSSKVLIRGFVINGHSIASTGLQTSKGIYVGAASSVVIERCLITHVDEGVSAYQGTVYVLSSNISDNENGIDVGGTFLIGNSVITNNDYGIQVGQGVAYTYGDNDINGNPLGDVRGTLTVAGKR